MTVASDADGSAGRDAAGTVVDLLPEAFMIVDAQTLDYVQVNAAACDLMGVPREKLLATPAGSSVYTGYPPQVLRAYYADLIRQAPAEAQGVTIQPRPDGSTLEVNVVRRAFQLEGRWCVMLRALSSAFHERASWESSMARHRRLSGVSRSAMTMVDVESMTFMEISDATCSLLGRPREVLMAQGPAAMLAMDEAELKARYTRITMDAPQLAIHDAMLQAAGGARLDAQITSHAALIDARWVVYSTIEDLTAQREMSRELKRRMTQLTRSNRELERSNQELERFAYVASHDLSEPLRMVASYTQLLERRHGPKLDDEAREFIAYAVDGARRMKRVIDDLLAYSRAGRVMREPSPTDMNAVLRDALANLAQLVSEAGAVVESDTLPAVHGDAVAFTQLFQNLLGNAVKFRREGHAPRIEVGCRATQDGWLFHVRDDGIGIEPRYFERIFQIFQRLHTQEKFQGTGIGLAICKKIVERHGGRIWVESRPGEGTTFFFTIAQGDTE